MYVFYSCACMLRSSRNTSSTSWCAGQHAVMICRRPEPGSVSQARQALLRFTAPITMGGDEPIDPPPLEEVVNALKVLAYHPAGGGATESHRAHLYSAALAFIQIIRDDGRTLRCACVGRDREICEMR